jgi:PIN domain nuclease of toxin-antitoxin system
VNALLDTQIWLWSIVSPDRLNQRARQIITSSQNRLYFSAASAWEIAIKYAFGKLPLPEPPEAFVQPRLARDRFQVLAVSLEHALQVAELPPHHRDPFDRMLVAQSRLENLPLLTADPVFGKYDVRVIPAAAGE